MNQLYLIYKTFFSDIIVRNWYLQDIQKLLTAPVIKVIMWLRRVWKSFILYQILSYVLKNSIYEDKEIFYVNKELLEFDFIQDYKDLNKYFNNWKKDNGIWKIFLVAIDEVQEIEWWEKFVNSIFSQYKKANIFVTWSNSNLLSSNLATYLAWRYIEKTIYPLSLKEFSKFKNKKISTKLLDEYIHFWWLPTTVFLQTDELKYSYLQWVYNTVLLKDILNHYTIRQPHILQTLHKYLLKNSWMLFNGENIVKYLKSQNIKTSIETILNYIKYSTSSFLVWEVDRYDIKGKKLFQISKKYYSMDLGIRNSLVWIDLKNDIWIIYENLVRNYLVQNGRKVNSWQLYENEIDFIAQKQNKKIYIQVTYLLASKSTIDREFWNLLKIKDNRPKIVISADTLFTTQWEWIKWLNILDFLRWK